MSVKVGMVSLGCNKNQVDAEIMLSLITEHGFVICADPAKCDVVIINTCGFIEDAKREAIENILEFAQLKKSGVIKAVVVTGCLAERYQMEIAKEIPEADVILGIGSNKNIAGAIERALSGEKVYMFGEKTELPLSGSRIITTPPYTAYLKIAEGCDNRCTYCAIPLIRGGLRSRPLDEVVAEAEKLVADGVRELNVIAQDTTRYGEDLGGGLLLPKLLTRLCSIKDLHWVRVLYAYPDRVTDELLDVMAKEDKICKYIDIPLQHASGKILKRMNRRFDRASLTELLNKTREKIKGVTLRTTFITGFPGETEEDFTELCTFVKEIRFDRLGCFAYSAEEDTPAASMPDQLDDDVKRRRAEVVMELQMGVSEELSREKIGKTLEVLVEAYDKKEKIYSGRTAADAPEIDGNVYFTSKTTLKAGSFVMVTVDDVTEYDLLGHMAEQ
ncbi:MAG: 30S ribosomal protein S12 methylthiotransferase RimO [Hydrogenoanaerobacterium sp.]